MGLFSNYCGPGGKGIPRHVTDTLCKLHDESEEYKHIIWAYTHFNGADEDFLKALGDVIPESGEERIVKWGAETYFNLKKKFFPSDMGRSPSMMPAGKRRSTTTDNAYRMAGLMPPAKVQALRDPDNETKEDDWQEIHSFENSPAEETMAMQVHGVDNSPKGIEGAEDQLDKPHDIWTRFPNHQFTKLGWWYTNYMTDITPANVVAQQYDAFDQPSVSVATALGSSGGGARTNYLGAHALGATGITGISTYSPSGHDFKKPVLLQLRMTTPYNIFKTYTGDDLVNNTVGNSQPNWLEMFDAKYQYYHVIETEWRIDFNFGIPFYRDGDVPNNSLNFYNQHDCGYYIFWKYTSNDVPPTSFSMTNSNIANVNNSIVTSVDAQGRQISSVNPMTGGTYTLHATPDDYFRMKGFQSKHVSLNSTHATHVTIGGKYKFGQCKMDIKTQDHSTLGGTALQTEGWLASGTTYLFPEDLTVIIVADNAMNANAGVFTPLGYRINTENLIEFRDLRSAYKFPNPSNAFINSATTLNTEAMFFNKGGAYT